MEKWSKQRKKSPIFTVGGGQNREVVRRTPPHPRGTGGSCTYFPSLPPNLPPELRSLLVSTELSSFIKLGGRAPSRPRPGLLWALEPPPRGRERGDGEEEPGR